MTSNTHPQCGKDPDHVSTNASGGRKNKLRNISNTKNRPESQRWESKQGWISLLAIASVPHSMDAIKPSCPTAEVTMAGGRALVITEQTLQARASPRVGKWKAQARQWSPLNRIPPTTVAAAKIGISTTLSKKSYSSWWGILLLCKLPFGIGTRS